MITKMANKCLNSSPTLHTLTSSISSPSTERSSFTRLVLAYRSAMFGTKLQTLASSNSSTTKHHPTKRPVTANLDAGFSNNLVPSSMEQKANSADLPFSLRIINCSVKKALCSTVFILRELQSYTLQLRELLFYEDLQDIVVRAQNEMNASFVWLFQQVFSQTPTLMVYVMILLANYSVHSMSHNFTFTALPPPPSSVSAVESVTGTRTAFDSSSMKTFSVNSGDNDGGGGGRFRGVGSGTDGDGRFDRFAVSSSEVVIPATAGDVPEETVSGKVDEDEERWNWIVDEAGRMQGVDCEMMSGFVSPVRVRIEEEDAGDYLRTEFVYQTGLLREPDNPLLLANYAQFLYLVARDYDRAEDYFKRAFMIKPKDAESLNKYASFLWLVRKDLWAAEETYLEAISADPNNSFYAANYAHFLWNTGGEDTCFPLDSPENIFFDDL